MRPAQGLKLLESSFLYSDVLLLVLTDLIGSSIVFRSWKIMNNEHSWPISSDDDRWWLSYKMLQGSRLIRGLKFKSINVNVPLQASCRPSFGTRSCNFRVPCSPIVTEKTQNSKQLRNDSSARETESGTQNIAELVRGNLKSRKAIVIYFVFPL